MGLKTITGRTITLRGVKPNGTIGWQRQNFYLYGVVEPMTGDSFFWEFSHLDPWNSGHSQALPFNGSVPSDSSCFQEFLKLFSQKSSDELN
jgi:hypothetical protein